jgi:hypothetical protein
LHKQVQKHVRKARNAEQFFFGLDSTFGGICELLQYDETRWELEIAGSHRDARSEPTEFDRHPENPPYLSGRS